MTIMPHPEDEYEDSELRVYWRPTARHPSFHGVEPQRPYPTERAPPDSSGGEGGYPTPFPYVPTLESPKYLSPPPPPPPTQAYYPHPHAVNPHAAPNGGAPYYYHPYHPPPACPPPCPPPYPPPVVYVPPYQSSKHQHPDEKPSSSLVPEVRNADVLCGRGAPSAWHPGNQSFRRLVSHYQPSYLAARRADKPEIAMRIVQAIQEKGGRFLKRTKMHGAGPSGHFGWTDIGENRAYEKACQALREGAPEIRRQMLARQEEKKRRAAAPANYAVVETHSSQEERDDSSSSKS